MVVHADTVPKDSACSSYSTERDVGSSWKKSKIALAIYIAVLFLCTQSKGIQSMILYVHVVNFPFWLKDTAYHGLPEARNIAGVLLCL